jgi:cell wall-associated NlpC family hydrolase
LVDGAKARRVIDRAAWVAHILTYEGVRFRHQGRNVSTGIDCPAPVILGARHFGIVGPEFDISGYDRRPDGSLRQQMDKLLVPKAREAVTLGDVILNAFADGPEQHIGIVVGHAHGQWVVLHANAIARKVLLERIQYGPTYYRYVQGYNVPGVV